MEDGLSFVGVSIDGDEMLLLLLLMLLLLLLLLLMLLLLRDIDTANCTRHRHRSNHHPHPCRHHRHNMLCHWHAPDRIERDAASKQVVPVRCALLQQIEKRLHDADAAAVRRLWGVLKLNAREAHAAGKQQPPASATRRQTCASCIASPPYSAAHTAAPASA